MIYTISEWIATVLESVIIFIFLIATLSYKPSPPLPKLLGTSIFCVVQCSIVFLFNHFYLFEGILIIVNILIYVLFCIIFLQKKFWYQCIVVLLAFIALFCINSAVTTAASTITGLTSDETLALRNPIRILLLFLTKIIYVFVLALCSSFFKNKNLLFHPFQCVAMAFIFLITFIVGVVLQRIQIEQHTSDWESSIIVICMIAINVLLFFILYQITIQNRIKLDHALLRIQMENEQRKIEDSVRWSTEVEALRHDLRNHLFCISEYIRDDKKQDALQYIEQMTGKVTSSVPHQIMTEMSSLNAILDLKRMECKDALIDFKCFIIEKMPAFNEVDLCIILSNLLDNAIEAERKEQKREIKLSISTVGNYLRITVQNSISKSVLQNNKDLKTSKDKPRLHGFGIQSITETVEKNDGMLEFYEEDRWFVADIMVKIKK